MSTLVMSGCTAINHRPRPPESVFDTIQVTPRSRFEQTDDGKTKTAATSTAPDAALPLGKAIALDRENELALAYLKARAESEPTTNAQLAYLETGFGVADTRCNTFMTQLGLAVQDLQFTTQEITLAGAATAAIQGLTKVATKEIAITSTLFGLGGASVNAYGAAYLFSPDITAIRGQVARTRDNFRVAVDQGIEQSGSLTFNDANTLLTKYETICTVDNIRSLINQSVKAGNVIAEFATPGDATIDSGALSRYPDVLKPTIDALKAVLSTTSLSDAQVTALYGLSTLTSAPTATQDAAFSQQLTGIANIVKGGKLDPTVYIPLQPKIAIALGPLSISFKPILDAKLKALLAAPTAATTSTPAATPAVTTPAAPATIAPATSAATPASSPASIKRLSRSVSNFSFTQSIQTTR